MKITEMNKLAILLISNKKVSQKDRTITNQHLNLQINEKNVRKSKAIEFKQQHSPRLQTPVKRFLVS